MLVRFGISSTTTMPAYRLELAITTYLPLPPLERPQRGQKHFYSGKKKRHTFKSQLVVDVSTHAIICTAYGKGRRHDFRLEHASRVRFHYQTEGLGDRGYQGIHKLHPKSRTPKKKLRKAQWSVADRQESVRTEYSSFPSQYC